MDKKFPQLSPENFDRLTHIKNIRVRYNWEKAWDYMMQKGEPVTVAEIHIKAMSEVPRRKQVRAWMERNVKNGRLAKVRDSSGYVFYWPRSMLEDYRRRKKNRG